MAPDKRKNFRLLDVRFSGTSVIVIALALMLTGCSAKSTGPDDMENRKVKWSDMDLDQRKQHMAEVVVPVATSVFQSWRPERYTKVDCTLCHGPGVQTENFQMPTSHLPRLSGKLLLGPEFEKDPDTTRLKLNRLVPEMAEALQLKKFNLITRRGFGCYSCHLGPDGPVFGN
jgi:hypothetical protein